MYLIAGLGNPSLKYSHTRHNAGFDALDYIASQNGIAVKKKKYFAALGEGAVKGEKVILLKPQTFMNRSGESIAMALDAYGLDPSKLIVLVDDIALEYGVIRIREKGSAGGHNGLKDIIKNCGTQDFMRVRIGVGTVPEGGEMINHVLSRPRGESAKLLKASYEDVCGAVNLILTDGIQKAMNAYNGKQKTGKP